MVLGYDAMCSEDCTPLKPHQQHKGPHDVKVHRHNKLYTSARTQTDPGGSQEIGPSVYEARCLTIVFTTARH